MRRDYCGDAATKLRNYQIVVVPLLLSGPLNLVWGASSGIRHLHQPAGRFLHGSFFSLWADVWQFSERMHLSPASRPLGGESPFHVSQLRGGHCFLRQHSGAELDYSAGPLPQL
jgi:hypothetical protein